MRAVQYWVQKRNCACEPWKTVKRYDWKQSELAFKLRDLLNVPVRSGLHPRRQVRIICIEFTEVE